MYNEMFHTPLPDGVRKDGDVEIDTDNSHPYYGNANITPIAKCQPNPGRLASPNYNRRETSRGGTRPSGEESDPWVTQNKSGGGLESILMAPKWGNEKKGRGGDVVRNSAGRLQFRT